MRSKIFGVACLTVGGYLATYQQATPPIGDGSLNAQALFVPQAGRLLYRYSVVPGGVQNAAEVKLQREIDGVVAAHYQDIPGDRLTASTLSRPQRLYVSYRRNNSVYWTRQPVSLPAGERVLSDGARLIRVRCGNRLSATPMRPVAAVELPAGALDELLPREPAGIPAAVLPIGPVRTAMHLTLLEVPGSGISSPLLILTGSPAVTTPGTSSQPTLPGGPGPGGNPNRPTGVSPLVPAEPGTPMPSPPGESVTPPAATTEPDVPPAESTLATLPPTQPATPTVPTLLTVPAGEIPTHPGELPALPGVPTTPTQPEVPVASDNSTPEVPVVPVTPGGETSTVPEQPTLPGVPETPQHPDQPNQPTVPETLPEVPFMPVPEPGTYVLVGLGLVMMAAWRRR